MTRRSISLPLDVHDLVSMIKQEYEAETERRHTYPAIIFMLCQYYLTSKEGLPEQVDEEVVEEGQSDLKKQLEETNAFIREAFMKTLDSLRSQPTYVLANTNASPVSLIQNESTQPKKTLSEAEIKELRDKALKEGKNFVDEMDNIIEASGSLSPSLVAQINECEPPEETPEEYTARREAERKKLEKEKKKAEKLLTQEPPKPIEGLTPPP